MRRRFSVLVLAIVAVVVAWYVAGHQGAFQRQSIVNPVATPATGVRGLIVEPDDGREPIIEEIDASHDSIDVLIYLLTDSEILDSLIDAERRGVDVRVILEEHPFGGFGNPEEAVTKLRAAGAEVEWSSSAFTFSHVKTLIFDRSAVAILNLNLTRSSFEKNREFGVLSTWPADVLEAQEIFEADWNEMDPVLDGSLIVSPTNSRTAIMELIDGARDSIKIYAEVIRDDQFVERIQAAESRGVEVEIVMSKDDDPKWQLIAQDLANYGVEIRISSELYIHAKAILVDDRVAYVGSQNFTMTSLDENREIGIVVSEPALLTRLSKTFQSDFSAAISGS